MILLSKRNRVAVLLFMASAVLWIVGADHPNPAYGKRVAPGPSRAPGALPPNLFAWTAPAGAISVGVARQNAKEGETIALFGKIGGAAKPIARNRAIFLMTDALLPGCTCGCPTPWDSCCVPREKVVANMVTIQIPGRDGRPLKANLLGVNGLEPAAEVIVRGTVVKRTPRLLILNAKNIYVKSRPGNLY